MWHNEEKKNNEYVDEDEDNMGVFSWNPIMGVGETQRVLKNTSSYYS